MVKVERELAGGKNLKEPHPGGCSGPHTPCSVWGAVWGLCAPGPDSQCSFCPSQHVVRWGHHGFGDRLPCFPLAPPTIRVGNQYLLSACHEQKLYLLILGLSVLRWGSLMPILHLRKLSLREVNRLLQVTWVGSDGTGI